MKRIWQVQEQTVEDPSTKLRLEFSSVHSDELQAGNDAPAHDNIILLRLWTSDRTRLATFQFERNGRFIKADVETIPEPASAEAAGDKATDPVAPQGEQTAGATVAPGNTASQSPGGFGSPARFM
jgi:hypothetical protein